MCSVSMVGDFYRDQFTQRPSLNPYMTPAPFTQVLPQVIHVGPQISREEFDDLKRQVLEMRELLKRAKEYDERNGEPHCEVEEKMDVLRRVAKLVGVNLSDVIGEGPATV